MTHCCDFHIKVQQLVILGGLKYDVVTCPHVFYACNSTYVFLLRVTECCNVHFGVFILYIHIVLHVKCSE